jgi:hypothetical protein
MTNFSLIRSLATGAIAGGAAALCWFNRLPKHEQEEAEQKAREVGRLLIDQASKRLGGEEPPQPMSLPR